MALWIRATQYYSSNTVYLNADLIREVGVGGEAPCYVDFGGPDESGISQLQEGPEEIMDRIIEAGATVTKGGA